MDDALSEILESPRAERLATGFQLAEGPLWDPNRGCFYFDDTRSARLYRIVPGQEPEIVRENTGGGSGTTWDLEGRIVSCEGGNRRVTKLDVASGQVEVLADNYQGKRFNHPNDIACRSDGSVYFTDPVSLRLSFEERELPNAGVYRITPEGEVTLIADCEYPNGLAFSPDESRLYVANTRSAAFIHELYLDGSDKLVRRRIFADMSPESGEETDGVPDGMRVDVEGRVYCAGSGGVWVFEPDGGCVGIIRTPERVTNLVFGGVDLRTLFVTGWTSVYTYRVKTAGLAHPRFRRT